MTFSASDGDRTQGALASTEWPRRYLFAVGEAPNFAVVLRTPIIKNLVAVPNLGAEGVVLDLLRTGVSLGRKAPPFPETREVTCSRRMPKVPVGPIATIFHGGTKFSLS